MFLPFIGYQSVIDEQVGASFYLTGVPPPPLKTQFVIQGGDSLERTTNAPVIGMAYRYRPLQNIWAEAAFGLILDGETMIYQMSIPVQYGSYSQVQTTELIVSRSNTMFGKLDFIGQLPAIPKWNWLSSGIRVGMGYGAREIKKSSPLASGGGVTYFELNTMDAEQFFTYSIGVNLAFWRENMLLIEGSAFYTRFLPYNSDSDPYGGIGWQFSVFPIWSRGRF